MGVSCVLARKTEWPRDSVDINFRNMSDRCVGSEWFVSSVPWRFCFFLSCQSLAAKSVIVAICYDVLFLVWVVRGLYTQGVPGTCRVACVSPTGKWREAFTCWGCVRRV